MRKTKISAQEKLHTVKNILHGIESIHDIVSLLLPLKRSYKHEQSRFPYNLILPI